MAQVAVGDPIKASTMNDKVDSATLVQFGSAVDDKFAHVIFVGTDAQWNALSATEKAKYIMRGVPS